jgi:hypothetical protein
MQNLINATGPVSRAIGAVLASLGRERTSARERARGTGSLFAGLAQESRMENVAWLTLAVAGVAGLVISLWI